MDLKVVYHYHSGFSVQCEDSLLIFDYWRGEKNDLGENGCITGNYLRQFRHIYVFVSHEHPDHFDPIIYEWRKEFPEIRYIISDDISAEADGLRMSPGQTEQLDDLLTVTAYQSTDLGVAFLVKIGDRSIFHAGDLNLWHWRQESTIREIEEAENAFYAAIAPLHGQVIDLAMFPVDPRQGMMYDAGANHFIMMMKPQVFIPMHWQDRAEVACEFARRARNAQTEVLPLTRPGVTAIFSFTDSFVDIRVIEPPKELSTQDRSSQTVHEENDPFRGTDMPVQLD